MTGMPCAPAPQVQANVTTPRPRDLGVVIVAAGSGERFGRAGGKALVPVAGRPLVAWSILAADQAPSVSEIVVVCRPRDLAEVETLVSGLPLVCPVTVVAGGATRQESVQRGVSALSRTLPLVAVHDGARPLVTSQAFERLATRLRSEPALAGLVAGAPSVDTLKVVGPGGQIVRTPDRTRYWCVQTPQVFRAEDLRRAHGNALAEGFEGTDDASLVERFGLKVAVAQVLRSNGKLTYPEDLVPLEAQLLARESDQ